MKLLISGYDNVILLSQYIGLFQPLDHLNGCLGCNFTAFIFNKNSANLTDVFDSEIMGQKYKIFYRRHHFVFNQDDLDQKPCVVIYHVNKDLIKSLLNYLRECKTTQVVQIAEDGGFEKFLDCFKIIHAAGGAVFNPDGDLLLMKRKGLWDMPKGKLDKGESIVNAAVREVEEECNVFDIEVKHKIGLTYHLYFEKKWLLKETHWYYMISSRWQDAQPQIEEEIEEIMWIDYEKLDLDQLDTYNNIRHVIRQL